ncbi:MAG: tetratricopeptide repeat protein [Phycisphaerae bacterium]|jgi:tetratricopeptide (TPR) repeat protein
MRNFCKTILTASAALLLVTVSLQAERLANEDLAGLYARNIEQVMRLDPDEIDIGIASLIIAEEWSDVLPGRRYQTMLDDMAYEIQSRLEEQKLTGSYKAVNVLNDYLHNEMGFKSVKEATDPNDLFMHTVMDNRRGYCLSLSILYLALAERLDIPLYGVVAPGHFFVRYDDGRIRFNIETTSGTFPTDEHYIEEFKIAQGQDGLYMKNLNKLQTLGCLFNNFGTVYMGVNRLDEAQRAMELAVEINPDLAESRMNLGSIYMQKDRIDDAIRQFQRVIEINPLNAGAYNSLGILYWRKNWTNDAMGAYEQAIRLDPDCADAYINLAVVYSQIKMYPKALLMLKEAAAIDPGRGEIYVRRGDIYFKQADYQKALEEYDTALRINALDANALFATALCYNKLDMPKTEIQFYERALNIAPDMFAARANLGNAYFAQQNYVDAVKHYKVCIQLQPDNVTILYNLGAACTNTEDYSQAVIYYQKALEVEPRMADAHKNLGFAYYKLQNYNKAYEHFLTAQQLGADVNEKLLKSIQRKIR